MELQDIQNILITNITAKNGNSMQNTIDYNNFLYGSIVLANNFNSIQLQNSTFYNIQLNNQGILNLIPGQQSDVYLNYLKMESLYIILPIELQKSNLVQSEKITLNGGIFQMNVSFAQQIQIYIDNLSLQNFISSEYFVVQWIYLVNDANKNLFFKMSNSIADKIEGNLFYYQSYYQVGQIEMTNSEIQFNNITVQNCNYISLDGSIFKNNKGFDGGIININSQIQIKEVSNRNLGDMSQNLGEFSAQDQQFFRKLKLIQSNYIFNSIFDNNFSQKNGGALNILNSDIQLSNNTFSLNYASENGGSIFYYSNSSLGKNYTLIVSKQTQFVSNYAQKGSAIRSIGLIQYSNDTVFKNNTSQYQDYNPVLTYCIEGEYIGNYNYCENCPSGTYSLINNAKSCLSCPSFCKCPGGSTIEVQEGYWRPNIYSDQITECQLDQSVCLGGSTNFTCQQGYTGALCKSCDIHGIHTNGTPYSSQIGQFDKCTPCVSLVSIVLQIIFLFIVSFITMIVSVTGTVKLSNTLLLQKNLGRFFLDFSQGQTIYPTYILKIFTHYIQIVGIFFSNQFNLISQMINIQSLIGNSTKMFSYQIDCLLVLFEVSYPLIYLRIIALFTYTALLSIVFTLIFSILLKLKVYTSRISVIYLNSLIFIYIYFQPVATQQLSSIISCQQISGESYISADLQYECNDENYNQIVYPYIYPIFILLNVIIPAFFIIKLYFSYKNKLLDTHYYRSVLGYLYNEYRQNMFYWELIKVFEKIALITINQIYLNNIQTKGFLSFMIISFYSFLSSRMQPYNHLSLNKLNSISTSISGITIIFILFLTTNQSSFFNFIGIAILCIINMYFILQVLRLLVYQYTRLFMRHLDALKAYLIKKFPSLKKYFKMRIDRHRKTLAYWKIFRKHVQNYIKIVKGAKQINVDKNYIDREIRDRLKNYLLNPYQRQNTLNRCIRSQVFEEEEILPAIQVAGLQKLADNNLNIQIPNLPKKSLNRTSIVFQIKDGASKLNNLEQSHISAVEEENSKQTVDSHISSEQSQKIPQKKECEKYSISPDMSQLNNSDLIAESCNYVKKNANRASTKNYDLEEQMEEQNDSHNINLSCCLNQINISKFNSYFYQE
ncbi:transmembrane protein, putative (macronuclear) [Tetrahymena thermophila SB210]|uniref:Transmembrane protein, putative n=1 Tax=Tetrahymena thermophila (strain SB210) TaxID=312017 RepID=Q245G2_TETTS|nr:transmembrane protein, putative [Tetrahymena thermophila SB210]EAS03402.2 transmembrane protein, putative [Tetrahymena thermophila SB210]|eukprot:XP_001023647.2 transmembrane protein, putative [Tetrahymena thermophila SB210]